MICSADRKQASAFREMISIANTSESIRSRPYKKIAEGPLGQLFDALGRHHLVEFQVREVWQGASLEYG